MAGLADRLDPAGQALRQNPRLAWGLVAICAILLVYLLLALYGWRASVATGYVEKRERLWRMQSLAGEEMWLQRAEDAASLKRRLEAQIPHARTVGLAQASAQSWARELADASGRGLTVRAQAPARVEGREALYRIPVVMSGAFEGGDLVQLLRRVEQHPNLVTVEEATVHNRQSRTFSLTLVTWYRVEAES